MNPTGAVTRKRRAQREGKRLFNVDNRVALVTGAASGIGAATAAFLARAGADVVCGWYAGDPHDVWPTVQAVKDAGCQALAVEADLADPRGADTLVAAALEAFGRIDIVVANAGIARLAPFTELDNEQWRQLMEVNLGAVFRCFRAALPRMLEARWGRLLATSSTAGVLQGWSKHAHYCASKGGIVGLVRGLAIEVADRGVTVNSVAPGVIPTPQSADPVNSLGPNGLAAFCSSIPAGRLGHVDEVAATFAFLASDEAAYITGQTIVVDGGASLFDGTSVF